MAKVTITFTDGEDGRCTISTDGLVSANGTQAQILAYEVARLLCDVGDIPWESVAFPVAQSSGGGN